MDSPSPEQAIEEGDEWEDSNEIEMLFINGGLSRILLSENIFILFFNDIIYFHHLN